MFKEIFLLTSIFDLSEELKGFSYVKFLDWTPDHNIAYSIGNDQVQTLSKGMELRVSKNLFIYKKNKNDVTLTLDLR